jgi:hypothetical protein
MDDRSTPSALPEEDAALFETLTPELARLLYPEQVATPFRVTMVYPELRGGAATAGSRIEATAERSESVTETDDPQRRTTFSLAQIEEFHELYHLVEASFGSAEIELLLNDRPVPLARELWLPLIWTLRK